MAETHDTQTISLELTHDEALVLFEWIHGVEEERRFRQVVSQSAEVVALWALSGALEKALAEPFAPDYRELIRAASQRLVQGQNPDPLSMY